MKTRKPTKKDTLNAMFAQAKEQHEAQKKARQEALRKVSDDLVAELRNEICRGVPLPGGIEGGDAKFIIVEINIQKSPRLLKLIKKYNNLPSPSWFNDSDARRRIKAALNGTHEQFSKFYELPATQKKIKEALNAVGLP